MTLLERRVYGMVIKLLKINSTEVPAIYVDCSMTDRAIKDIKTGKVASLLRDSH